MYVHRGSEHVLIQLISQLPVNSNSPLSYQTDQLPISCNLNLLHTHLQFHEDNMQLEYFII